MLKINDNKELPLQSEVVNDDDSSVVTPNGIYGKSLEESILNNVHNLLNENRSPIYHGTSFKNAIDILKSNKLIANISNETETLGVSFTRNPNEAYDDVRLKIDQNKLRNNYKVKPVYRDGIAGKDLAEERVPNTINDICKYIMEIELNSYMKINIIRRELVDHYGDKSILNKSNSNNVGERYIINANNLITECKKRGIKLGKLLTYVDKYLTMFKNGQHDTEYEKRLLDKDNAKKNGKKLGKFNPYK